MSYKDFLTIQDTREYYLKNIELYGIEAPRTMGYRSFPIDDRLISNLLPTEVPNFYSVLDVGCGLGQIVPILEMRYASSQLSNFLGLDLVDEFVQYCIARYPQHKFLTTNFLDLEVTRQFDLVLAAGVLVTRISNFEVYLENFIEKMVLASKDWIGFNVVGSCGPSYTAKHLATISFKKIEEILIRFDNVEWNIQNKEVFPGAEDLFICGRKVNNE